MENRAYRITGRHPPGGNKVASLAQRATVSTIQVQVAFTICIVGRVKIASIEHGNRRRSPHFVT